MYLEIFDSVERFICEESGGVFKLNMGKKFDQKEVDYLKEIAGFDIPISLIEFWKEIGFNSWIRGVLGDSGQDVICNAQFLGPREMAYRLGVHIKSCEEIANMSGKGWVNPRARVYFSRRTCDYLDLIHFGNGDCVSIDVMTDLVVFNNFDWQFYNGLVMAENLKSYISRWSQVCFQMPLGNWYSSFGVNGVEWNSDKFLRKNRRNKFVF